MARACRVRLLPAREVTLDAEGVKGFRRRFRTRFEGDPTQASIYRGVSEAIDILMKVETHNHPTAISPFPGASTGSGGEIRDEGATGSGAKPKAGLTGFSVSHLRIPGYERPWEHEGDHHLGRPE